MPVVPPPPASASLVFGPRLGEVELYARLLAGPGVERGLIGPREAARLWERHLLNSAVLCELIPTGATVIDLGSGAGLPGIVLAVVRPDLTVTLLEPMLRRVRFLRECVQRLDLRTVRVRRARAEEAVGEAGVDVVAARAVAPLDRLAALALPLLRPGGVLLAVRGRRARGDLDASRDALARCGACHAEVLRVGEGRVEQPATVVRVVAGSERAVASRRRG